MFIPKVEIGADRNLWHGVSGSDDVVIKDSVAIYSNQTVLATLKKKDEGMDKVRLGSSSCLLRQNVRYDDGHQLNRYLRDTLRLFVNYVPICPEVEMGLPTPRETLRLVGEPAARHASECADLPVEKLRA